MTENSMNSSKGRSEPKSIEAEKAVEDALSETDSDPDLDTLLRRVLDQR